MKNNLESLEMVLKSKRPAPIRQHILALVLSGEVAENAGITLDVSRNFRVCSKRDMKSDEQSLISSQEKKAEDSFAHKTGDFPLILFP